MLTPGFELKQDDNFLTIIIRAPYAKVSETEVFIEDNDFKFYSSPYYLRLTLPGNIVEDSREKADYDASKGVFTIKAPKETPGEHFEGLDMLTKLLAPKGQRNAAPPLIQVIESAENGDQSTANDNDLLEETEDEEFDWSIEQTPFIEQASPLDAPRYGFASQKSGVFQRLQEELQCIVDVPDPDKLPMTDRRELRIDAEREKFDGDHYIADLYDDELIKPLLSYQAPWAEELKEIRQGISREDAVIFTDEEKEKMRNLPRKEYLLDDNEAKLVYLGLIDIIYAYCYNHRTTEGENNVESGWTISKLSATLSWLELFSCIEDVLVSSVRRSLCYPLYRHWQLSLKVLEDVKTVFQVGRRRLLKSLLEIHSLLIDTESRYILNDLYISDYCVWIQSASDMKICSLSEALNKVSLTKKDIGFSLEEIEREAACLYEDESIENITADIDKLSVTQTQGDNTGAVTRIGKSKGHNLENDGRGSEIKSSDLDSDDTGRESLESDSSKSESSENDSDGDESDSDGSVSGDEDTCSCKIDSQNVSDTIINSEIQSKLSNETRGKGESSSTSENILDSNFSAEISDKNIEVLDKLTIKTSTQNKTSSSSENC